ncbi:MAG: ABC transporter permease [SAR324 cluster bacterium]|nr:ABC transporter permease [SAR324 cluster bacterium]
MTDIAGPAAAEDILPQHETRVQAVVRFFRTKPLGAAGLVVIVIFVFLALFAGVIAPYDPLEIHFEDMLEAPSWQYWMGTDDFGRDILSRIIYGSRTAMTVGLFASFIGATLGLIIGVASAYFGGITDLIVQRLLDIFMSFPLIVMALAIVSVRPFEKFFVDFVLENLGVVKTKEVYVVILVVMAITVPMIPRCARVVRSSALAIREVPYVDAARALGFRHWRIISHHMIPNVMAPYLIMITAFMGQAILLEAALSFLGLGVTDPIPAWGLMLQGGAEQYAETAPWLPIFPGLAITISVFAFNLFGDSLRDVLDPKLRV